MPTFAGSISLLGWTVLFSSEDGPPEETQIAMWRTNSTHPLTTNGPSGKLQAIPLRWAWLPSWPMRSTSVFVPISALWCFAYDVWLSYASC